MKTLGLCLLVELAGTVLMSRHGDFLPAGEAAKFTVSGVAAGLAFWLAAHRFTRPGLSPQRGRWIFWSVAVVIHTALLPTFPGDDVWRYRWEGAIQLHGFNPYRFAPDASALASLRDADWAKINHRDFPAIYPPLTEMGFTGLAAIGNSVLGYKLLFTLANLGVIGLLRSLLGHRGVSPDTAAWYAWNPLVAYTSAGAAHFDAMMLLPLLGAVWCLDRFNTAGRQTGASRWLAPPLVWLSVLLLGISIAVKIVPMVLLPVWLLAVGWRRALLTLPVAVGILPALAVFYGFPQVPVFAALGNFARGFEVNGSAWWLGEHIFQSAARPAIGAANPVVEALVCGALAFWFRRDWRRGMLWVLGAALLLGPQLHAWYVVWVLPLAVWRGESARAWVVFSVSVFGYFLLWEVNHASGRPWEEPWWLRGGIYLPPLLAWAWTFAPQGLTRATAEETC